MFSCKKLSICIVNYQSQNFLEKCLFSIFQKIKNIDLEVIVVNNDERENLENIRNNFPGIKIIDHKKNVGFGAGHNLGAREAQGEIILILNPDAELVEDIEPVIDFFRHKKAGIIGVRLVDEKGKTQEWCAGKETSLWGILGNNLGFSGSKKIWKSQKTKEAGWVSGAALFIRKDLFDSLKGFDENFFMYYEDEDLCKRVKQSGEKVIFFPKTAVRHWGGKSIESKQMQKKYFYTSQDYYFEKHLGKWQALILETLRKIILGN